MQKHRLNSFILVIAVFLALIPPLVMAADFSFSDDFSGDFNIDRNLSNYELSNGNLTAPVGFISSRIVSALLINTSYNIGSAKLEVSDSLPAGGRIVYSVSNDDGATWVTAQNGVFVDFQSFGKKARWSAVIVRANTNSASPVINSIKITVRESDPELFSQNDSQRIADLSAVASAVSEFYRDFGIYPHVDGPSAESRWNELMVILSRNRNGGRDPFPYLYSRVDDPLRGSSGRTYDYKDLSPNDYVLKAVLENGNNNALRNDIDGALNGIDCNDPSYCIGVLRNFSFTQNSGGFVLGASTSSFSSTTTTTSFVNSGLNLNSIVANPLNTLIGREVFRFDDFFGTTLAVQTETQSGGSFSGVNNAGNNSQVAGASIAKVAGVSTGTTDSLAISLFVSSLVTLAYLGYTKTGLFKRREAEALIRKFRSNKDKFNFARY